MGGNRGRYRQNYSNNFSEEGKQDFYEHDNRNQNTKFRGGPGRRNDWQGRNNYEQADFKGRGRMRGRFSRGSWSGHGNMPDKKNRQEYYRSKGRGGWRGGHNKVDRFYDRHSSNLNCNFGWNKVSIKNGANHDEAEVLACIKSNLDEDFTPHLYGPYQNDLSFFIEANVQLARAILKLSGRMTLNNGQKLHIIGSNSVPPPVKPTNSQIAVIEKVLSDRFSLEMSRIDLQNFHNDSQLVQEKICCPLYRQPNLELVLELLLKNVPTVKEVDLSQNNITNIFGFELLFKCQHLEILNLSKNKMKHGNFSKLKGLGIIELALEGNPLCDNFKDAESYTSTIRKYFPKVLRLDGVDLPKPISFGLDETQQKLPLSKPSFIFSEEVQSLVFKFIEQYYQVFESSDRRPLEAAYTVDAHYSFVTSIQEAPSSTLNFLKDNRNLLKDVSNDKRKKIFSGHSGIVDFISKFPKLIHDPNSFVIDIPFVQSQLMQVVLTGVFRYQANYNNRVRAFMRSLIIVPVGSGFCISNEELFFCHATPEQFEKSFKSGPVETPSPSPSGGAVAVSSPVGAGTLTALDPLKIDMLKQFCLSSKMLPEFCRMCLEKNDWDFNKAGEMFLSLQKENKIPPEYFGT